MAPKTALVLAGGGSYGAAQVGMLRSLCAHGVRPDLVVGSSVGAINGAFYAGMPTADGIAKLESIWRGLRRRDVFPIALTGLLAALLDTDHLFESRGLRSLLATHLPFSRLEDSALPVHVIVTDLLTGSPVRMSNGSAVAAILASCAIPAIFPPVQIGDRKFMDGGVAGHTPVRAAIELGAKRLIILSTAFACSHAAPPKGVIATAFHAMSLSASRQLDQDAALNASQAEIIRVPPLCPVAVRPYDFSGAAGMIDLAARSTDRWIEAERPFGGGASPAAPWSPGTRPAFDATRTRRHDECAAALPTCAER